MTLGVGQKFPDFSLKASATGNLDNAGIDDVFVNIDTNTYKGMWKVVFFYPKDFTFVCPTEIAAFGNLDGLFKERNAQLLGASVDSEFVHLAWRRQQPELKNLPIPLLADVKRELSTALGIIDPNEGVSQRAVYIIDPENIIRFVMITDLSVGRNPQEVLRILDALQSGELCPCNWNAGEDHIDLSKAL